MEKYENVEKRVGRDNTPQLQAENGTAEGLNIIKSDEAGRAAGSNDLLPKLELSFGDLEKKSMEVSRQGEKIGGVWQDTTNRITDKELDNCLTKIDQFSPEQQETIRFLAENKEFLQDLVDDGTGITTADIKAYDTLMHEQNISTEATDAGHQPVESGETPNGAVTARELRDVMAGLSWEADGQNGRNGAMSKEELDNLIEDGETASGRDLTAREIEVLKVMQANYDDLNNVNGSTLGKSTYELPGSSKNDLSLDDFDRLVQMEDDLARRKGVADYFNSDENFRKFEKKYDERYSSHDTDGFITYEDLTIGNLSGFTEEDKQMQAYLFLTPGIEHATEADSDYYTQHYISQADTQAWYEKRYNQRIEGGTRTVGQLLDDLHSGR